MTRRNERTRNIYVAILVFVLVIYPTLAFGTVDIGCYQVDKASPIFRTCGGNYDPVTARHEDCIYACYLQSARHSGLQASQCLCTDTIINTEVTPSCGDPCPGDSQQSCGNDTHIAVPAERVPQSPPIVRLSVTPDLLVAEHAAVLTAINSTADLDSYLELQFDPGDGTQATWTNSTNSSHVYSTSGHFVAVLTVRKYSLLTAHSVFPVTVTMAVAGMCVHCPVIVETGKPFECLVELEHGSDLTLNMSIGDEELVFQKLGDSKFTTLGVMGKTGPQTPATSFTWILPATQFVNRARLLAVEALITDVGSGSFTLLILNPICSGATYCAADNLCHSDSLCKYDATLPGSPLTQDSCNSAINPTYCIARQACMEISGNNISCPNRAARFETDVIAGITTGRPNYEIVEVIPMTVSKLGLFHHNFVNAETELFALDIRHVIGITFTMGGANIGFEIDQSATDALEYKSTTSLTAPVVGGDLPISSFGLDSSRHFLRVIAVDPVVSQPQLTIGANGDYDLLVNVMNDVALFGVFKKVNITSQTAIVGLQYTNLVEAVRPLENLTIVLSVLNGSHINYELDWGDGGMVEEIYFLDPDPFNVTHVYSVAGNYELNVVASNGISNQTLVGLLRVQNPVLTEHFRVTMETPQGVEGDGTPTVVDIVLTITNPTGDLQATDPQASFRCLPEVAYPEGRVANLSFLTSDGQSASHPMSFTTSGHYFVNATIYNLVSEEVYTVEVMFFEKLKNVSSITRYKPSESLSSLAVLGHSKLLNIFPLDRPVIFNMSFKYGSDVEYLVDFGDESSLGNYSHGKDLFFSFDHKFPEKIDSFEVSIKSSNPVTPPTEKKVRIILSEPIRAVTIKDMGISRANETRELNLTMQLMGTKSCVVVDYDDNTPTEAYGKCDGQPNHKGDLRPWVNISHVFEEQMSYSVKAMGYNDISSSNITVLIPVLEGKKYCGLPDVSVQDAAPGWWLPIVAVRKSRLVFQGTTKLNCWFTENTKSWSLERLDPQTGAVVSDDSDILGRPTISTLLIQPFTLVVGLYRLGFKVTMDITQTYGIEVSAVGYEYFDIQRSQLNVGLIEGQMTSVVRGWGSNLTLIPGHVSKDPDVPPYEDQAFEEFLYLCRRVGEKYPSENANITIPDIPVLDNTTDSKGGCFNTGPGILNYTTPTLSWDTFLMKPEIKFELLVIVKKDIRRGNFSLILELRPGDPPQVAINIGQGTIFLPGNGAQIINPTGSVRLTATCNAFCSGIHYEWKMMALIGSDEEIYLSGWEKFTTGVTSEFLYIKKEFFADYPQYSTFSIVANADNDKGSSGYAGMKIQLNKPPIRGECSVDRYSIAARDTVHVKCEGWSDWEGIVQYRYFVQTAEFKASLLNSVSNEVVITPPIGSENNDYVLSLGVTAEDRIGATTTLIFANITVTPPMISIENFTSQQETMYKTLQSESNPVAINAQLVLDASLLGSFSSTSHNGTSGASSGTGEGTGSAQSQDARAKKTEIVTKMVGLQSSLSVSSSQDIVLKSSTIALISKDVSTLSPKALDMLASVADDMVVFVENDTVAKNDESKLNNVGEGIVSFLGNVMVGAGESVTTTSSSDAVTSNPNLNEEAAEKADAILFRLESVAHVLYSVVIDFKLPGEEPTRFSADNLQIYIDRNKASDLMKGTIVKDATGEVKMAGWCELRGLDQQDCVDNETVSRKLQSTPKNPYIYAAGSHPDRKDAGLVNITFFSSENEEYDIQNLSEDNFITIHFSQANSCTQEEFMEFDPTSGNGSFFHRIDVEGLGENIFIEIRPENESTVYALIMSYDKVPTLEEYDFKFQIPNNTEEMASSTYSSQDAVTVPTTPNSTDNVASRTARNNNRPVSSSPPSSDSSVESTTDVTTRGTELPIFTSDLNSPSTGNTPGMSLPSSTDALVTSRTDSTPTEIASSKTPRGRGFGNSRGGRKRRSSGQQIPASTVESLTPLTNTNSTTHDLLTTDSDIIQQANSTTFMPDMEPVSHIVAFGPDLHKGKKGRYLFRLVELDEDGIPQNFTSNYSLRILQAECAFFQFDTRNWSTEGVRAVLDPQTKCPICQSSHLTPFTSSWIVKPVPLDWDKVFAGASPLDSPVIYATCIVIYTIFFFIFSWARRKDKKDIMMLGVTPLPDNNPRHSYLYELVVITGKRINAGTESKVSFILSGDDEETSTRTLEDPKRGILCRGGTDRFLLATAKPLGTLNYMRMWHDNSGQGTSQSWYLSYIVVRDLQTKRRYFFIANQWFSLVDGDGQVDRLLPVAGREQMREFGHVFASQTGKHFNDGHLWISIVTRPAGSRFTRMQRGMCCLMALWLELLTNIMFYQVGSGGIASHTFSIGPFSMSTSEIAIGVESNLIVFPISLLMVQFFKKSRLRQKRPSRIMVAKESQTKKFMSDNKVHPQKSAKDGSDTVSSKDVYLISDHAKVDVDPSQTDQPSSQGKTPDPKAKKPQHWSFPWWFVPIAWIVCLLATITATFFTLFYGLQMGNSEVAQWLRSIIISFFCGIILTQPIKVIMVSLFIALVFKTANADEDSDMEEDEEDCELQGDEEWLHTLYGTSNIHPAARAPPDPHVVEDQRTKRINELKMYAIIREIVFSIIFVWILSIFSYGNQDPFSFWTKNAHVNLLVHGDGNHTLMKATSIPKFWLWVDNSLTPAMFAGEWYNGDPPSQDEFMFLGDRYSKILGKVIFRQQRVPKGDCEVNVQMKTVIKECNIGYSGGGQDERQYGPGWTPYDSAGPDYPQYRFTEAEELDSYTVWGKHGLYRGGGYIYYINMESENTVRETMAQMYEEAWIDRYTRAVFIEFSVYNAQTNLFSFINLMMEILPTGGSYPRYRIDVLRLLTYHEGIGLVRLLCEIAFFIFIICMTFSELNKIRKEKKAYFKLFWNLNELSIICMSIVIMVIYMFRLFVINSLLVTFADREKRKHVNLQYVAYWNELIGYILGIVVFLSTLKFLKLLRFNRRIGLLSSTISSCRDELFNFTFMFFFVFVAFASAFFLIFCNRLVNYSDILSTMETMITAVLGKFKFGELLVTESILGPIFFFGFTGYVCFVMINMFLTIIIGAFKTVKGDLANQSNDYEMVDFILKRFKAFTGIKNKNEDLPNLDMEEYEADLAKSLPDKVDQLLEKIAHSYFDQGTFNDFAKEVKAVEEKKETSKHSRKIFLS